MFVFANFWVYKWTIWSYFYHTMPFASCISTLDARCLGINSLMHQLQQCCSLKHQSCRNSGCTSSHPVSLVLVWFFAFFDSSICSLFKHFLCSLGWLGTKTKMAARNQLFNCTYLWEISSWISVTVLLQPTRGQTLGTTDLYYLWIHKKL